VFGGSGLVWSQKMEPWTSIYGAIIFVDIPSFVVTNKRVSHRQAQYTWRHLSTFQWTRTWKWWTQTPSRTWTYTGLDTSLLATAAETYKRASLLSFLPWSSASQQHRRIHVLKSGRTGRVAEGRQGMESGKKVSSPVDRGLEKGCAPFHIFLQVEMLHLVLLWALFIT